MRRMWWLWRSITGDIGLLGLGYIAAGAWIYSWVWSLEGAVASLSHFRVRPCDLLKQKAVTKLLARCCA